MALLCGMFAFVFIEILCRPYEVFGWWPPLLRSILFGSTAEVDYEDMKWWQLYLYKPFAGCGVCFSGWVAMSYYVLGDNQQETGFFPFIFFVSGTIFTAWVLYKIKELFTA